MLLRMVRVLERLVLWLAGVGTGFGLAYLGVTAPSSTSSTVVGVFIVVGVALLVVSIFGFGAEAAGALRARPSAGPAHETKVADAHVVVPFPSSPSPAEAEPEPRVFVPGSVTPEYLFAFFEGHTTAQGQRSVADYIGKWMPLAGPVNNVQVFTTSAVVTFLRQRGTRLLFDSISMWFRETSREGVMLLNQGDQISVVGRIESVSQADLQLQDCELV